MVNELSVLFHKKWSIPLLAELKRQGGSKFVTLQNRLDAGPTSLRHTLQHLMDLGLICRNPGHGHPMRPEYVLTPKGMPVAEKCYALVNAAKDHGVIQVLLLKWSLPVLAALGSGAMRFSELRTAVSDITARALALYLKEAQAAGVIQRQVKAGYPPTATYALAPPLASLATIAASLCA